MTAALQIQPSTEPNIVRFDPARPSALSTARGRDSVERRPVRMRTLACALAIGALVGGLLSLDSSTAANDVDVKTELGTG